MKKKKKRYDGIQRKDPISIKLTKIHQFEKDIYNDAFGNKRPIVQWYKYIMEKKGGQSWNRWCECPRIKWDCPNNSQYGLTISITFSTTNHNMLSQ